MLSVKCFKPILISVLCFAMSISMLYQPVYAIDNSDETKNVVNTTAENYEKSVNIYDVNPYIYEIDDIDNELVDKREENVKHFRMSDGTIQAYVYNSTVHELDENDVYQEVDNTLSDNNSDELENTKNDKWKVKFSKKAKKTLLHIHDGNMNIKWGLVGFNKDAEVKYLENDEEYTILSNKAVSQTIVYEDILDNVDVQYQVGHRKVKENLVLKNTEAQHVFYYELDTNGYDISIDEDNRIVLSKNNKEDYYIEAPFMLDSEGIQHDGIALSLEDKYIKMELDSEWLLSEERVYPVYVDPTINNNLDRTEIKTTSVYSASPNSTQLYSYGGMIVGKEASAYGKVRGAMKFNLPTIDESSMVVSATITLSQLNYSGGGKTVYAVMGKLQTNTSMKNLTWNKFAGNCVDHNDYIAVYKPSVGSDFLFDCTKYVREWYQKGNNYGVGIASENESGEYMYATFVTSNNTGMDTRFPRVCVTYISQDGLEPYLTYQTMNTTSMGTFNVSDFNGNLIYTYNDFSMSGNYLPVGISHVYNHHQRGNATPVSSSMKYGKGMRLNVSMEISYNQSKNRFELIDEDGTTHYFLKEANQNRYQKENDTEVKLYDNTNDITIDNKTQRIVFNKNTGFLDKVEDKTNNKEQKYTYTNNQLTSITDGAGRETTLTYTNNFLTKIQYAGGGETAYRVIEYTYDGDYLSQIKQSDGNIITFTYSETGELASVSNANEGKVTVEYVTVSPKRVSKLTRIGTNNNEGDSLSFVYELGETRVTDEDGYTLTYMFDRFGHTVSTIDSEGNGMFGVYGNTDDNNKHSLNFESKLQTSTINLAMNHSPVDTTNWTSNQPIALQDTNNETKAEFTGKAFKLTNSAYLRQPVAYQINAGEAYTVSAYVKISSLSGTGGAYVGVYANNTLYKSRIYSGIGEWRRISYTFIAPSTITSNNWNIEIGTTNMTGEVLVKNIQLEKGTVANRYNFIENGHFKEAAGSTSISNWSYKSDMTSSTDKIVFNDTQGKIEDLDGTTYLKVVGGVDKAKYLMQTVNIKGKKGDVFVLSGWNKNNSMIQKGLNVTSTVGNTRERSVKIHVYYKGASGQEVGRQDVYFSSASQNWQYSSGSVVAPADYSSIEVRLYYSYQKGYGLFDNIQMYVESFGTTYEHDDKGRVISEQDVEGNITKTEYMDITITEDDGTTSTIDVVKKHEYKRKSDTNYLKDTVYTYNGKGKILKEVYTDHNVTDETNTIITDYKYDVNGNLEYTSINGEKKYESGYLVYDSNYVSSYTDEKGKETSYEYNQENGNIDKVIDKGNKEDTADDIVTTYTYQGNTSRVGTVTTDDSIVNYTYNSLGLVKTISHNTSSSALDVVYTFNYDEFGNVASIKVGDRTLATYAYGNKNGEIDSTTYGTGEKLSYEYDELGRVTAIYEGTVKRYSWDYGNEGKIGRFIDYNTNGTIRYSYDIYGNVTEEERSDGTYLYNTYKKDSSLLSSTGYEKSNNKSSINLEYNPRNEIESVAWNTNNSQSKVEYTRDFLRRINLSTYKINNNAILTTTYNYLSLDNNKTSNVLNSVVNRYNNNDHIYSYDYDGFGNIKSITYNGYTNTYEYDKLNQITRENNQELGKTYTYEYDDGGNIKLVNSYNYTLADSLSNATPLSTETYNYEDTRGWKDLLTKYNNKTIEYDEIGNPTKYHDDKIFVWNFRRLEQISDTLNNKQISYSYNQDDIRTSKTVNGVTTNYVVSGSKILQETTGAQTLIYEYDDNGNASSFVYSNGNTSARYIYVRNGMNDVIGILNTSGNLVASYKYDGWGNCTVENINGNTIGTINPIRYRSYYYDSETGYYYLNSRYYDSNVGRFLNADSGIANVGENLIGNNMFAYCFNNPINMSDESGYWPNWAKKVVATVAIVATIAVVTTAIVATAGVGSAAACIAIGALKGAASGAVIGAAVGGTTAAVKHRAKNKSWDGVGSAILDGVADGALSGAITGAITGGINSKVNNLCFVAGTVILTEIGKVVIEEISVGDVVWSENPETGQKGLKKVVQIFENETNELVHIYINNEKITTTPEHPFYVISEGWVAAKELEYSDILLMQNGNYIEVDNIVFETIMIPITVYNFEVEDYHTYYVGEHYILTHNECNQKGVGGKGWVGDRVWKGNVKTVSNGGTITSLNGGVPTESIAKQLINESGGTILRIEGAHLPPNPHTYSHINYLTKEGVKGTLRIFE